jgi:hypothetical protein
VLEIEGIDYISDEMRAVVEELWPELTHKLRRRRREAELKKAPVVRPGLSRKQLMNLGIKVP